MIVATVIIASLYCIIIIAFSIGFHLVDDFELEKITRTTKFTVIIPFRNEEKALLSLLMSIKQLNYPQELFEIIFVDDGSEDGSVEFINEFINRRPFDCAQGDIKVLNNNRKTGSPKKDAINTAIAKSNFDWIITTDADCSLPKNWLLTFDAFIQKNKPKLIVAPVTYTTNNRFIEQFQLLDFLSLQGSTIGGFGINKPFLCNGANLCYSKQAFKEVNGFEGNASIASGDDIFLLEKISASYPKKVHYLKSSEAIVKTEPQHNFKELVNQRVRWATKSTAYKNPFSKLVSLSVFAMNALLIILLLTSILGYNSQQFLLFLFVLKFLVDIILIFKTATFFKQLYILKYYLLGSLLYPLFIMFVIIVSLKSGYNWKGRQFKK
jgi:cellulose synthase/poly-beta-1,6-N-acetylglucosamine synthase-like glycosyltransferase